jgi:phosphoglycolate phosphatase-like HAD superfamily hydrolase
MTPFAEKMLVIFDYSGTLSLEAPRFGRPASLVRALAESGLFSLGVTTSEIFWGEIVGPTWIEGSTTAIGYKRVMAERIDALGLAPGATGAEITAAASRFVDRYLDHSRIDPHWRPLLEKLTGYPGAAVAIATDHYAEATETIIRYLHSWDIPARKAGEEAEPRFPAGNGKRPPFGQRHTIPDEKGGTAPDSSVKNRELSPLFIANSADIGFWKADRRFWEVLKSRFPLETVRSVLIIDDFGFNEDQGDRYGEWAGIEARQEKTFTVLGEVFQAGVEVIPFFLKDSEREDAPALRIAETGGRIGRFLNSADGARNL